CAARDSNPEPTDLIKTVVRVVHHFANLVVTWAFVDLAVIIGCRQRWTRCVQRCGLRVVGPRASHLSDRRTSVRVGAYASGRAGGPAPTLGRGSAVWPTPPTIGLWNWCRSITPAHDADLAGP